MSLAESLQIAQPTTETLDAERADKLVHFVDDAVEKLSPTDNMTGAQTLSLLVGFAGLRASNTYRGQTFTLVYTDPDTGISNYQTACVPTYSEKVPFGFRTDNEDHPASGIVSHDSSGLTAPVRIHAQIRGATNHHYSRVDTEFRELPIAVIASPRSACAAGCEGCARGAIKSFTRPSREYIQEHVGILAQEYDDRGWDRADLGSVNITTGSQPTEIKEVDMMVAIMKEYGRQGFSNARFHIYNYALRSREAMQTVLDAGAIGYIGTLETANDTLRRKYWGHVKGGQTFDEHLERYHLAHEVGFPIVETNYVVGLDPYAEMMAAIRCLDEEGVAVVPNVQRRYTTAQFDATHPDLWEHGFRYITDAFEACLLTYRHPTIKRFAGELAVSWLKDHDPENAPETYLDLPIRHT